MVITKNFYTHHQFDEIEAIDHTENQDEITTTPTFINFYQYYGTKLEVLIADYGAYAG